MKTILTTLLLLCLITTQSFSQWEWQNPRPHGNANNRLAFGDNQNTYSIVGNAGIIIKTTDDGVNWESQNSGTIFDLSDIYISGANAIAVGESGTIRRTTDGGNNWTSISSGTTTNLTAVTFATTNIGIITGWNGLVLRTTNSGSSWSQVTIPVTQRLYGISFSDANNGIAVGDGGVVLKTADAGVNWNSQTSGTIQSLYDVSYVNSSTAVAAGFSGTVIRTTNGGSNWNSIGLFTGVQYGVSFTDPDHGVVVGDVNGIQQTTDGGAFWTLSFSSQVMQTNFHCVRFYNSTKGVAVGEWGAIFKTDDGGITWQIITAGSLPRYQWPSGVNTFNLYSVQCINPNRAVIGGTYQFFFTNNGGVSWDDVELNDYLQLNDLDFVNQDIGAMIGFKPSINGSDILGTTNSGSNWSIQYTSNSIKLNGIDLSTATHAIAVGDAGKILMTTNGGQNWTDQNPIIGNLYDVFLVDANIGYTVGRYGTILKTTDGGLNWTQQHYNLLYNLFGVAFSDANNGIAVGERAVAGVYHGTILKTTDGGANWSETDLGSPLTFLDVTFADNNNWYASGVSVSPPNPLVSMIGRIFRSTNAGNSWSEQNLPIRTTRDIVGISAFNNDNLLAVGSEGMLLATTNGGVNSVEEVVTDLIPTGFELFQNYPNPFNPSTTISWQSPTSSHQTLKIYDLLGNEVATLVDEFLPTGTYKVNFDASGLSSGIYFYKLQAGTILQTRKMILLK